MATEGAAVVFCVAICRNDFEKPLQEITYWTHGDFIGRTAPVNGTAWSFIDMKGNNTALRLLVARSRNEELRIRN